MMIPTSTFLAYELPTMPGTPRAEWKAAADLLVAAVQHYREGTVFDPNNLFQRPDLMRVIRAVHGIEKKAWFAMIDDYCANNQEDFHA